MTLNDLLRKLEFLAKKYFKKQRGINRNGFYECLQQFAEELVSDSSVGLKCRMQGLASCLAVFTRMRLSHNNQEMESADNAIKYLFLECARLLLGVEFANVTANDLTVSVFCNITESCLTQHAGNSTCCRWFEMLKALAEDPWNSQPLFSIISGNEITDDCVAEFIDKVEHPELILLRIEVLLGNNCADMAIRLVNRLTEVKSCDVHLLSQLLILLHNAEQYDEFHKQCTSISCCMACDILRHVHETERMYSQHTAVLLMSRTFLILDWTKKTDMTCTKVLLRYWLTLERHHLAENETEFLASFHKVLALSHSSAQLITCIDVMESLFGSLYLAPCMDVALRVLRSERHRLDCARLYLKDRMEMKNASKLLACVCDVLARYFNSHLQMKMTCLLSSACIFPSNEHFVSIQDFFTSSSERVSLQPVAPTGVEWKTYVALWDAVKYLQPPWFHSSTDWEQINSMLRTHFRKSGWRYDSLAMVFKNNNNKRGIGCKIVRENLGVNIAPPKHGKLKNASLEFKGLKTTRYPAKTVAAKRKDFGTSKKKRATVSNSSILKSVDDCRLQRKTANTLRKSKKSTMRSCRISGKVSKKDTADLSVDGKQRKEAAIQKHSDGLATGHKRKLPSAFKGENLAKFRRKEDLKSSLAITRSFCRTRNRLANCKTKLTKSPKAPVTFKEAETRSVRDFDCCDDPRVANSPGSSNDSQATIVMDNGSNSGLSSSALRSSETLIADAVNSGGCPMTEDRDSLAGNSVDFKDEKNEDVETTMEKAAERESHAVLENQNVWQNPVDWMFQDWSEFGKSAFALEAGEGPLGNIDDCVSVDCTPNGIGFPSSNLISHSDIRDQDVIPSDFADRISATGINGDISPCHGNKIREDENCQFTGIVANRKIMPVKEDEKLDFKQCFNSASAVVSTENNQTLSCDYSNNRPSLPHSPDHRLVDANSVASKAFKCSHCSSGFTTIGCLRQHMLNKHKVGFACPVCQKLIGSRWGRGIHLARIHGPEIYRRYDCENTEGYTCRNNNRPSLQHSPDHRLVDADSVANKVFKCSHCSSGYTTIVALRQHMSNKHKVGFACPVCQKLIGSRWGRGIHLGRIHGPEIYRQYHCKNTEGYACRICSKILPSPFGWRLHLARSHSLFVGDGHEEFRLNYTEVDHANGKVATRSKAETAEVGNAEDVALSKAATDEVNIAKDKDVTLSKTSTLKPDSQSEAGERHFELNDVKKCLRGPSRYRQNRKANHKGGSKLFKSESLQKGPVMRRAFSADGLEASKSALKSRRELSPPLPSESPTVNDSDLLVEGSAADLSDNDTVTSDLAWGAENTRRSEDVLFQDFNVDGQPEKASCDLNVILHETDVPVCDQNTLQNGWAVSSKYVHLKNCYVRLKRLCLSKIKLRECHVIMERLSLEQIADSESNSIRFLRLDCSINCKAPLEPQPSPQNDISLDALNPVTTEEAIPFDSSSPVEVPQLSETATSKEVSSNGESNVQDDHAHDVLSSNISPVDVCIPSPCSKTSNDQPLEKSSTGDAAVAFPSSSPSREKSSTGDAAVAFPSSSPSREKSSTGDAAVAFPSSSPSRKKSSTGDAAVAFPSSSPSREKSSTGDAAVAFPSSSPSREKSSTGDAAVAFPSSSPSSLSTPNSVAYYGCPTAAGDEKSLPEHENATVASVVDVLRSIGSVLGIQEDEACVINADNSPCLEKNCDSSSSTDVESELAHAIVDAGKPSPCPPLQDFRSAGHVNGGERKPRFLPPSNGSKRPRSTDRSRVSRRKMIARRRRKTFTAIRVAREKSKLSDFRSPDRQHDRCSRLSIEGASSEVNMLKGKICQVKLVPLSVSDLAVSSPSNVDNSSSDVIGKVKPPEKKTVRKNLFESFEENIIRPSAKKSSDDCSQQPNNSLSNQFLFDFSKNSENHLEIAQRLKNQLRICKAQALKASLQDKFMHATSATSDFTKFRNALLCGGSTKNRRCSGSNERIERVAVPVCFPNSCDSLRVTDQPKLTDAVDNTTSQSGTVATIAQREDDDVCVISSDEEEVQVIDLDNVDDSCHSSDTESSSYIRQKRRPARRAKDQALANMQRVLVNGNGYDTRQRSSPTNNAVPAQCDVYCTCDQCPKAFTDYNLLMRHKSVAHRRASTGDRICSDVQNDGPDEQHHHRKSSDGLIRMRRPVETKSSVGRFSFYSSRSALRFFKPKFFGSRDGQPGFSAQKSVC